MIRAIDRRIEAVFSAVLRFLCKLTGKDNFFFTRAMAILSVCLMIIAAILFGRKAPMLIGLVPTLIGIGMLCTLKIDQAEKRLKAHLDEYPFTLKEVNEVRMTRNVTLFLTISSVWIIGYVWLTGSLFICAFLSMTTAHYFILDVHPKSKSSVKRAIEWLQAHRPRLPQFHPNPTPG